MPDIDSFFASVRLPSISHVTQALISTLDNEQIGVHAVCSLIAQEPAIATRLLRLANSSQFGLPRSVGLLTDAVNLVGFDRVRALAVGAALSETFDALPGLDRQAFWRGAMDCAGYAQWLAEAADFQGHVAWLTGMMLRLGELLIYQAHPEVLEQIEQLPLIPGVRWQREERLTGFTEGQITAEMARRWNFPPQMVQGLRRAADPMAEDGFSRLGAILHLAGLLAESTEAGPQSINSLPLDVLQALELDLAYLRYGFPQRDQFIHINP